MCTLITIRILISEKLQYTGCNPMMATAATLAVRSGNKFICPVAVRREVPSETQANHSYAAANPQATQKQL